MNKKHNCDGRSSLTVFLTDPLADTFKLESDMPVYLRQALADNCEVLGEKFRGGAAN